MNKEYEHKQDLIAKAKAEFVKKNMPESAKQPGGGSKSSFLPKPVKSSVLTQHSQQ